MSAPLAVWNAVEHGTVASSDSLASAWSFLQQGPGRARLRCQGLPVSLSLLRCHDCLFQRLENALTEVISILTVGLDVHCQTSASRRNPGRRHRKDLSPIEGDPHHAVVDLEDADAHRAIHTKGRDDLPRPPPRTLLTGSAADHAAGVQRLPREPRLQQRANDRVKITAHPVREGRSAIIEIGKGEVTMVGAKGFDDSRVATAVDGVEDGVPMVRTPPGRALTLSSVDVDTPR